MNLLEKRLWLSFLLSLTLSILWSIYFPSLPLAFLVPCIIISLYQKSLLATLWFALFCGLLIDLTSTAPLGTTALAYTLVSAWLYRFKFRFFADSLSTLPLMTFFFSFFTTLLLIFLRPFFEGPTLVLSWEMVFTDLLLFPGLDSLYAFFIFIFPFTLFGKKPRKGRDYFF